MRFVIEGDPISVAFGSDTVAGVFLSVFDRRLEYDPSSTPEVNAVTEKIGVRDGGGSYFDLHTGDFGFGIKVDDVTMATYLKRFGVTDEQISSLPLTLPFTPSPPQFQKKRVGSEKLCTTCGKKVLCKDCSLCKQVPYCSRSCQRKDWPLHKLFCGLQVEEEIVSNNEDNTCTTEKVNVFLLPEDSDKPKLISVQCIDGSDVNYNGFSGILTDKIRSDLFTDDHIRNLKHAYHVIFRDNFMGDGSKQNKSVQKLFQIKSKQNGAVQAPTGSHWKGDLLICKAEATSAPESGKCLDITPADATEVVNFLYSYTSANGLL